MDRRTRICIWIILLGLANFLAYSIIYIFINGEAIHGYVTEEGGVERYYLQGSRTGPTAVSKAVYIYSGIHSISIWPTVGAIMLAMLTLAKERIVSSMRSTIVRGRTFITILATIITLITAVMFIWFVMHFARFVMHFASSFTPTSRTPPPSGVSASQS
jgi:hypothetical protein